MVVIIYGVNKHISHCLVKSKLLETPCNHRLIELFISKENGNSDVHCRNVLSTMWSAVAWLVEHLTQSRVICSSWAGGGGGAEERRH